MATPNLNVEFAAVKDEHGKFARLATLLGLADADHARGKCEHLWMACTVRGESKIGLPVWVVEQVLGERGPAALVEAELASWSRGRGDAKARRLRIGGAVKHCSWMASNTDKASKGGKSRASTASRAGGKFTSDVTSHNQPYHPHPHPHPHSSPQDQIPDPPPARAIPPVVPQPEPITLPVAWSGPPDHRAVQSRRAIAKEIRAAVNAARERIATSRGEPHRPLLDQDPGEQLILRFLVEAVDLAKARDQLLYVAQMAEVEARHKGLKWFTLSATFSPANLTRFAGGSAAEFAQPDRQADIAAIGMTDDERETVIAVLAQLSEGSSKGPTGVEWTLADGHSRHVVPRLREIEALRPGYGHAELAAVAAQACDQWEGQDVTRALLKPSVVFGARNFPELLTTARRTYGGGIEAKVRERAERRKAGA